MPMPTIIAMTSKKGGTGKTTLTLGLGAGLALKNKKVLLVDMDSQGNTSSSVGCDEPENHIGKLLLNPGLWAQTLVRGEIMDILPAATETAESEALMTVKKGSAYRLKELLGEYAEFYDYVLIDCPTNMGTMTEMALNAAHFYIVPMQGENFSFKGLAQIRAFVATLDKPYLNPNLKFAGVVRNKFTENTRFGKMIDQNLQQDQDLNLFKTRVRICQPIMESTFVAQSIFQFAPKSNGAKDFSDLTEELLLRIEGIK